MATIVVIAGETATGKSTSYCPVDKKYVKIIGLPPEKTFIFNVVDTKMIPIKGGAELYPEMKLNFDAKTRQYAITKAGRRLNGNDYGQMLTVISLLQSNTNMEYVIVDDFQYLMAMDFFERRNEAGYDKYGKIGFSIIELVRALALLPDSVTVFLLAHTDEEMNGDKLIMKLKTIGKMLDEKFSLTGLFSIVLNSRKEFDKKEKKVKYYFSTKPLNESDISKSPIGMFEDTEGEEIERIPNDLGLVASALKAYSKLN
jgi:hypothetical protein